MQFVPIIPRPRNLLEDRLEVKRLAAVKAAKPVQQRTLPPLLTYQHNSQHRDNPEQDRRQEGAQVERRTYCRRVQHLPVLEELRSAIDRRKQSQRGSDQAEHIDVEV